jgi:biopolymer transport protein ExbB/TolQ
MLILALLFPVGLMIFNPTLMFERGWEQYVGTSIYFWAVLTLSRELLGLWRNERAFEMAPALLRRVNTATGQNTARERSLATADDSDDARRRHPAPGTADPAPRSQPDEIAGDDRRILPRRVRQLVSYAHESRSPSVTQLMEVNREGSGLDQEQVAGRFTLTRYILYLLPVIGFIGTVEGISKALMSISKVLPMVKNLDGFLTNLTGVTAALQIAFDSTLLALFLSAALMLVQTLVYRRSEELLAKVDRWVVEHVLPRVGRDHPMADRLAEAIGPHLDELGNKLTRLLEPSARSLQEQAEKLSDSLSVPIAQFTKEVQRLPRALASFQQGAETIGRIGADLEAIGSASESLRRGVASLSRIEAALGEASTTQAQLDEIKRGLDRTGLAIESLAGSWSAAYERSSRATQEQLARSLTSLKDALELLNVSMEQGNALYRNIVKKLFDERTDSAPHRSESIRVA